MTYYPPQFRKSAFNCPHCGVFAEMTWSQQSIRLFQYIKDTSVWGSYCSHCQTLAHWEEDPHPKGSEPVSGHIIIPAGSTAPLPHPDMPNTVVSDYHEAREVAGSSPRAAAALLRLAIQKLCGELGESGNNINEDIKALVQKGLSIEIQQALDIIRVVGNNAVHPGELQPDDIADVALSLFDLLNQIVEERIAKPKRLKELFDRLPNRAKDAILKRDCSGERPEKDRR